MISFDTLNRPQKNALKALTHVILRLCNAQDNYRIEESENGNFFIRASTQNPPPVRRVTRLRSMLNRLSRDINVNQSEVQVINLSNNLISVAKINITSVSDRVLDIFSSSANRSRQQSQRVPSDVNPPELWQAFDKAIKGRWTRFSDSLRQHICQCYTANLDERIGNLAMTAILGDTFRSPVGLTHPRIPVRLPNSTLPNGQSNEVYDLLEILELSKSQDPADPRGLPKRQDPMTRQFFGLEEVKAAPEALEALVERLDQAQQQEAPRDDDRRSPSASG